MKFYLGSHQPHWLWQTDVPLFISRPALRRRSLKGLKPALGPFAFDSGGFNELRLYGKWTITAQQYVDQLRAWIERLGTPDFIAPMDCMCEPAIINGGWFNGLYFVGTGLSEEIHQKMTVENYNELVQLAPDLKFIPVLQGGTVPSYFACWEKYREAGVDLAAAPLVGLGSVCRRQATSEIAELVAELAGAGLKLHGFGVKSGAHRHDYHHLLTSADSMAWSMNARRMQRPSGAAGCTGTHINCANCLPYALQWRADLVERLDVAA